MGATARRSGAPAGRSPRAARAVRGAAAAIGELTERQREVFVAIALNEVSIDVLALQLRSNRNAIYKNLFDARRSLRARMAAAGHPVAHEDEIA